MIPFFSNNFHPLNHHNSQKSYDQEGGLDDMRGRGEVVEKLGCREAAVSFVREHGGGRKDEKK